MFNYIFSVLAIGYTIANLFLETFGNELYGYAFLRHSERYETAIKPAIAEIALKPGGVGVDVGALYSVSLGVITPSSPSFSTAVGSVAEGEWVGAGACVGPDSSERMENVPFFASAVLGL